MMDKSTYYIVDASILPPVVGGVLIAKDLLTSGKASSVSEAVKTAGISRSAFYKYRDFVFRYETNDENTVEFKTYLEDKAGVFSAVTDALSKNGVNILTINQSAPADGVAAATLRVRTDGSKASLDVLLEELRNVNGVIRISAEKNRR